MAAGASSNTMAEPLVIASRTSDAFASQSSAPSAALLDFFFPGLSMFTGALQRYLHIDLNYYFPLMFFLGGAAFAWKYFSNYIYAQIENHLMSTVEVRYDDEVYNMIMTWVSYQPFAQNARRFIVNTMVGSRAWSVWELQFEERRRMAFDPDAESSTDEDDDEDEPVIETFSQGATKKKKQKKALSYTPAFGTYYFWFRGHLLIFRRSNGRSGSVPGSDQRESITVSCFGRDPAILKALLFETRRAYLQHDQHKTIIYRGSSSGGRYRFGQPAWMRCMARSPRPLSTVILDEKVKASLVSDVADYLDPATRRWYANRGIPYRRGYLFYGPPGTGKSSLSVSLAGHFNMNIYIVSLNGAAATEEILAALFNELPRRCIVLLEDIDTAGLTHTRSIQEQATKNAAHNSVNAKDGDSSSDSDSDSTDDTDSDEKEDDHPNDNNNISGSNNKDNNGSGSGTKKDKPGRLSLSSLLNILDGVASQEGRILIMTTNHLEKLDKALIRPGRIDMMVKFDRADRTMAEALFRSIFATLEGDGVSKANPTDPKAPKKHKFRLKSKAEITADETAATAQLSAQANAFSALIPELTFSPAELQGYLLKHKRDPAGAVAGTAEWVAAVTVAKAKAEGRSRREEEKTKAKEERKKQKAKKAKNDKKKEREQRDKAKEKRIEITVTKKPS